MNKLIEVLQNFTIGFVVLFIFGFIIYWFISIYDRFEKLIETIFGILMIVTVIFLVGACSRQLYVDVKDKYEDRR